MAKDIVHLGDDRVEIVRIRVGRPVLVGRAPLPASAERVVLEVEEVF